MHALAVLAWPSLIPAGKSAANTPTEKHLAMAVRKLDSVQKAREALGLPMDSGLGHVAADYDAARSESIGLEEPRS
jgi:hypothetical protein